MDFAIQSLLYLLRSLEAEGFNVIVGADGEFVVAPIIALAPLGDPGVATTESIESAAGETRGLKLSELQDYTAVLADVGEDAPLGVAAWEIADADADDEDARAAFDALCAAHDMHSAELEERRDMDEEKVTLCGPWSVDDAFDPVLGRVIRGRAERVPLSVAEKYAERKGYYIEYPVRHVPSGAKANEATPSEE